VDTLYPASGALSTFLLSGFIPSNCVPLSLTFYRRFPETGKFPHAHVMRAISSQE
jgi:hypothetical protein